MVQIRAECLQKLLVRRKLEEKSSYLKYFERYKIVPDGKDDDFGAELDKIDASNEENQKLLLQFED